MQFEGALVREQGVTFGVVIVKSGGMQLHNRQATWKAAQSVFPHVPVVIMSQDHGDTPTYFGRPDLVRFLGRVPLAAIPWRKYSLN